MLEQKRVSLKEDAVHKQSWEPIRLTEVGHVGEVVQGGGGKLTPITADSGDVRKPKGQG